MVHIIPLSVGRRRLDTGNAVQYPQGSPIGGAMQGFGDELSALAEHYRKMTERQEAFDAEIARRQSTAGSRWPKTSWRRRRRPTARACTRPCTASWTRMTAER